MLSCLDCLIYPMYAGICGGLSEGGGSDVDGRLSYYRLSQHEGRHERTPLLHPWLGRLGAGQRNRVFLAALGGNPKHCDGHRWLESATSTSHFAPTGQPPWTRSFTRRMGTDRYPRFSGRSGIAAWRVWPHSLDPRFSCHGRRSVTSRLYLVRSPRFNRFAIDRDEQSPGSYGDCRRKL